jgi:hypothetical protein
MDLVDVQQEEALRRLCYEAERLIREAKTLGEAESIRDAHCARLIDECPSAVLQHGARIIVDRVIAEVWFERSNAG